MKNFCVLFLFFIGVTIGSSAQKEGGTSSRGYYKILASQNAQPKSSNEEIDKLKFPFDQAWADKVLGAKPIYLTDATVNDFKLPEPPANSSAQTRAELNYLLALQTNRTVEDIRWSMTMSENPLGPSDVGQAIGYWITPQKLPVMEVLMEKVSNDGDFFLWSLKFKYARVRPYVLEAKLHDLEASRAASYPSGHTTYAYIKAYIYQELAPEFSDLLLHKAYEMSHAREIIGVHYPSDAEGSRIFARQFVDKLFQNKKFLADFENAKKEWTSKVSESMNSIMQVQQSK
jgi:acid phosphatase (class A)